MSRTKPVVTGIKAKIPLKPRRAANSAAATAAAGAAGRSV